MSDSPQRIKTNADGYKKLRAAALDCIEEARISHEAEKVFKSEAVQDALHSSMQTVIRALEIISRYYSNARERKPAIVQHVTLS